jgi:ABC-type nitrate/sulfonate/bicarbonate transport system substrate-binding protein
MQITTRPQLPPAEKSELQLGYIRLTDAAPLIVAKEQGVFAQLGLDVTLRREVSWANLRDKIAVGTLDAAQMLAPLPLATALGVGGMRVDMVTGLALSLNGNAITVSAALAERLQLLGADPENSAASSALALRRWLQEDAGSLTLASSHSFSCHTVQLRWWLRSAGIDPERDLKIIVLPPEQMVDSLARGVIDGFCVGEPWNSIAVQHGIGAVQASGYQIHNNMIEKVLGVTQHWHNHHPATHLRLRIALMLACQWLAKEDNRLQAAELLARPEYLDLPVHQLQPSLSGEFQYSKHRAPVQLPHFHVFGRFQAGFPWRSTAETLLGECNHMLGRRSTDEESRALVQQTYRTDLYREAARYLGLAYPEQDYLPGTTHSSAWEMAPGVELGPNEHL